MPLQPGLIRVGFPGATEQPIRITSNPTIGAQTTRTWIGPLNSLLAIFPSLSQGGWECELYSQNNGVDFILTAKIGYTWSGSGIDDNPVDTWELTSNRSEKGLLRSLNPLVLSLSQNDITLLQNFIDNGGPTPPQATLGDPNAQPPTVLSDAGNQVYNLLLAGVDSVVTFVPTVRHTQMVSNQAFTYSSFANFGQIVSTFSLAKLMPLSFSLGIPPQTDYVPPGFNAGWLIDCPNITTAAFGKISIVQEYEFGSWSELLYGAPIIL